MGFDPAAAVVERELLPNQYFSLAAFTILYYDYFLTLPMEVERFWPQKTFSWAVLLFYLNRYMSLLGHIPVIFEFFWQPPPDAINVCHGLQTFHQYYAILIQLLVGSMLIMRVYALYDRNRWVLASLCLVATAVVVHGCWAIMSGKKSHSGDDQAADSSICTSSLTGTEALRLAAAWCGLLVFDIMVFALTAAKAIMIGRTGKQTLLSVLIRDGAVYFLVMTIVTLVNILTFLLGSPYTRGMGTTFANIISTTMISRLMLNIRSPSLLVELKKRPFSSEVNRACVSTVIEDIYTRDDLEFNTMDDLYQSSRSMDIESVATGRSDWSPSVTTQTDIQLVPRGVGERIGGQENWSYGR